LLPAGVRALGPVGIRVPAVGVRVPAVGMRVPAVGMRVPAVGMRVPAVGMRVPAVGRRAAVVDNIVPDGVHVAVGYTDGNSVSVRITSVSGPFDGCGPAGCCVSSTRNECRRSGMRRVRPR
jgi:hypothetical protein